MLKKLEKKRRVLELGFALGFALTVLLTAFAAHRRRQVADRVCADTVRLHILANSDTLEDQLVKLQVRDAILAALPDSVLQAGTTTGAEVALRQALPVLHQAAQQALYKAHSPQTARLLRPAGRALHRAAGGAGGGERPQLVLCAVPRTLCLRCPGQVPLPGRKRPGVWAV